MKQILYECNEATVVLQWLWGRESLGQVTNVWDEVGGRGEGGVLPRQPDLVRAIPSQRVQIVQENGPFKIFSHE